MERVVRFGQFAIENLPSTHSCTGDCLESVQHRLPIVTLLRASKLVMLNVRTLANESSPMVICLRVGISLIWMSV